MTVAAQADSARPRPLRSLLSAVVVFLVLLLATFGLRGWQELSGVRARERPLPAEVAASERRTAALRDLRGGAAAIVRLNPLLIGCLFPSHGEDRLIVAPDAMPPLLTATLKAVEDRRFDSHFGIDSIAVARALFVNVTAGEIREGASTLTQQLVRSYFLTNERTWWRKLREAFMAVALDPNTTRTATSSPCPSRHAA